MPHRTGCPNPHGDLYTERDGGYRCPRCRALFDTTAVEAPHDCQTWGHAWHHSPTHTGPVYRCTRCHALHVV